MDFLAKKVLLIMSSVVVNKAFVTSREQRFCRRLDAVLVSDDDKGVRRVLSSSNSSRVGFFSKESTNLIMSSVVVNKGGPFVCVF